MECIKEPCYERRRTRLRSGSWSDDERAAVAFVGQIKVDSTERDHNQPEPAVDETTAVAEPPKVEGEVLRKWHCDRFYAFDVGGQMHVSHYPYSYWIRVGRPSGGIDWLAAEVARLRNALGLAAIPLEALYATECDPSATALCDDVKTAIGDAVTAIRDALLDAPSSEVKCKK